MKRVNYSILIVLCLLLALPSCGRREEKKKVEAGKEKKEVRQAQTSVTSKNREETSAEGSSNHPPQILDVSFLPPVPVTGDTIRVQVKARDPDGDPVHLSFSWKVNGKKVTDEGDSLHEPIHAGDRVEVTVTASDGKAKSRPVSEMVTVANAPPLARLLEQNLEGNTYRATIWAQDPEGQPVSFKLKKGPPGMEIEKDGTIIWKIKGNEKGSFPVTIEVEDPEGGRTLVSFKIEIRREPK